VKGTIGRVGVVPEGFEGNIAREIARIRLRDGFSPTFVASQLESDETQRRILEAVVGTTRLEFSIAAVRSFQVAVPASLQEQNAIAEALSDADSRIAALEALIAKKRDFKQAAMQQLLTGKTRLPGFSGDWEVQRLGEFAQFLSGTYLAKPAYRPGAVIVQGAGAAMGEHNTANFPFAITVIGRVGTVGRPRFMPGGCWVNNNAAAIRALPSESDPRFVHLLLTQYDWSLATSVTAQPFLGIGTLMGSTHRLPPKAEQTAIAEVIFDMDAELSSLEAEADKARAIKQGMMQNLLTGKVRLV
jgi:type I restriction enzyme S subunit